MKTIVKIFTLQEDLLTGLIGDLPSWIQNLKTGCKLLYFCLIGIP